MLTQLRVATSSFLAVAILAGCAFVIAPALASSPTMQKADELREQRKFHEMISLLGEYLKTSPPDKFDAIRERGYARLQLLQLQPAYTDFTAALKMVPRDPYCLMLRAEVCLHLKRLPEGLQDIDLAIGLETDKDRRSRDLYLKSNLLREMHRNKAAMKAVEQAIAEHGQPTFDYVRLRGLLYQEARNFPMALKDFNAALALKPDSFDIRAQRCGVYAELGDRKKTLADCAFVLSKPRPSSGYYLNTANAFTVLKDYRKGLDCALTGLKLFPKDIRLLGLCSEQTIWLQQFDDTIKFCNRALAIDPKLTRSYYLRAFAYCHSGKLDEALADCDRVLQKDPNNSETKNLKVLVLSQYGGKQQALDFLDKELATNPKNESEICIGRAGLYGRLKQPQRALDELKKLPNENFSKPARTRIAHVTANAYLQLNQPEKALSVFDRYLKVYPEEYSMKFQRATVLAAMNRFEESVKTTNELLKVELIDQAAVHRLRANCFYYLRQFNRALNEANVSLSIQKNNPDTLVVRGRVNRSLHRESEAIADFKLAVKNGYADQIEASGLIAESYANMGRIEDALKEITTAIKKHPESAALLALKRRYMSMTGKTPLNNVLSALAPPGTKDEKKKRMANAINVATTGKTQEALNLINQLNAELPTDAEVLCVRGHIYRLGHLHTDALLDLTTAIKFDPNLSEAYVDRGIIYRDKLEFKRAMRDFQDAVRLAPNEAHPHRLIATLLFERGDFDGAIRELSRTLQCDDFLIDDYILRGRVYSRKQDSINAIKDFSSVLKTDPQHFVGLRSRAEEYIKQKNYSAALLDLDRWIGLDGDDEIALSMRANTYLDVRRFDDAVLDFTKLLDTHSSFVPALEGRARAYDQLGKSDLAEEDRRKVAELNGTKYP